MHSGSKWEKIGPRGANMCKRGDLGIWDNFGKLVKLRAYFLCSLLLDSVEHKPVLSDLNFQEDYKSRFYKRTHY